ncbi:Resolvase domain protein [Pseudofrankia inefficax]|uniref:Resolvase domain protein n=1 Tax=Pseudofrankia inefficax (strain DSM 45817 / CECT 9037 / DDB 130130 / EuI1c) TaxID=298654 RepID=E3IXH5_PSEI1|nr:Resolvase domain protein [Pseudofrankia inefficax]
MIDPGELSRAADPGRPGLGPASRATDPARPALSDLAVSPFALPMALLEREVRVAFAGRTSTEEQQDPRQSLIRQLGRAKSALPETWVIVAHYYDVESGRKDLEQRGHGADVSRFDIPIPRDGGIDDLLAEASHPNRRFDVVICESMSRIARRMYETLAIERQLEAAGVALLAWNEPIKTDGPRASAILHRRINQSVAEYEVWQTLESSWGGLCTHVRDGWNIGKPPYGYRAKSVRHPNSAKADRGATKSRLEPDGARGETVTQIAHWRYYRKLGYGAIAEALNADLERYPPPEPVGGAHRARGAWGKSTVADLLRNPKYTGYQVFNRRASRSRHGAVNGPEKWVWSEQPVHEPLIPKWMFDEFNAHRTERRGSRQTNTLNSHPATKRTYVFRGMVHCTCGRRMAGNVREPGAPVWYICWPKANNRGRDDKLDQHPKTVRIREDVLEKAIGEFYAERVFGRSRITLLTAELASYDDRAANERAAERGRLQKKIDDLTRRQANLLRQAQDGDPDDPFTQGLRATYNDLDAERKVTLAKIQELDEADDAEPERPGPDNLQLLDALPELALKLHQAPEALQRRLYEITQLTVQLDHERQEVKMMIKIPAVDLDQVATLAEGAAKPPARTAPTRTLSRVDAVRAPGRIRTCAPASGGQCSIP